MKRKTILATLGTLLAMTPAVAQINITAPFSEEVKVKLVSIPMEEYAKGSRAVTTVVRDSVMMSNQAVFNIPKFNAINFLTIGDADRQTFYTSPDESVVVTIIGTDPMDVRYSGTELLDEMQQISDALTPVMKEYEALAAAGNISDQAMEKIYGEYDDVLTSYIRQNPATPGASYAVTALQNDALRLEMMPLLSGKALQAPIYALAVASEARARKTLEAEARQKALESGQAPAPDFTLPDLKGNPVSLAQFRGKWVILDFWGSWCMWCIKGFPALKEAYEKNKGNLEVIGIDCGDSPEAWKAAVEKFKLPWVHLYNADTPDSVDKLYGIQGFPTKMIVNPEGKIVDITTGEDPSFFERLEQLMK